MTTTSIAVIAIVAALALLGVVAITLVTILLQLQQAEAKSGVGECASDIAKFNPGRNVTVFCLPQR